MTQVTLQVLEQQDLDGTPHRHPTEYQQALLDALHECASLDIAQQTSQPDTAGEDAQGNPECDASNPQTASKSPPALLVRAAKVFVNRVAHVGRMRAQRYLA